MAGLQLLIDNLKYLNILKEIYKGNTKERSKNLWIT
jgi:hypothetical protein